MSRNTDGCAAWHIVTQRYFNKEQEQLSVLTSQQVILISWFCYSLTHYLCLSSIKLNIWLVLLMLLAVSFCDTYGTNNSTEIFEFDMEM